MPAISLLEAAGIPKVKPSRFGSIYQKRFFTGYVSNRSPLEQGSSRVDERFYGGRSDVLWLGSQNIELSASGLLIRRPGFSSYTTAMPITSPWQSFYSFKNLSGAITLFGATATELYTVTPTAITSLYAKPSGAGVTQFLTVGNSCYLCDGKTNKVYSAGALNSDGIAAPATAPTLSFASAGAVWQANYGYAATGTQITDPYQDIQQVTTAGVSGKSQPPWSLGSGQTTADNSVVWTNEGKNSSAGVFEQTGCYYVYAYQNSTTGDYSTASPQSAFTGSQSNQKITVGGDYSADSQVDKVAIFRTLDGGATFMLAATIANVVGTGTWSWVDQLADSKLNLLILAPINHQNDPAPAATCQAYYAGRRWVGSSNYVYFSSGPDQGTVAGNGQNCFPPANVFTFPTQIMGLIPFSGGLLVVTTDSLYAIGGSDLASFYVSLFIDDIGVLTPNAIATDAGSIILFTSDRRLVAIGGAGVDDIGFAIADQLAQIDPSKAYIAVHREGSNDRALYLSDGVSTIWRMNPNQAPEGGIAWSAPATPANGVGALVSCETSIGTRQLLMSAATGTAFPILYRDTTVNEDNGTAFTATAVIGSLVLAAPGGLAEVKDVIVEASPSSTPTVGVLLNEISGTFQTLNQWTADPPEYATPSASINARRYYLLASQQPIACRHLQLSVSFPAANTADILYSFALNAGQAL